MRRDYADQNRDRLGRRPLDYSALGEAAMAAWHAHFARLRPEGDFSAFCADLTTTIGRWHGRARVELVRPGDQPSEHAVFALAEIDPETLLVRRLEIDFDGRL